MPTGSKVIEIRNRPHCRWLRWWLSFQSSCHLIFFWSQFDFKFCYFPNSLKYSVGLHFHMLSSVLIFSLPKFLQLNFFGKFNLLIWYSKNWLKFSTGMYCATLITILIFWYLFLQKNVPLKFFYFYRTSYLTVSNRYLQAHV